MIEIDKELLNMKYSKQCTFCKHNTGIKKCKAFDVIPDKYWNAEQKHTQKHNGYKFEPKDSK